MSEDAHAINEEAHAVVSAVQWHQRLGHRNMADLQQLGELGILKYPRV